MTLGPTKDGAATGPKGKFAASASFLYKKIIFPFIPICMSPGSLKESVADVLSRSERNKRFHDCEIMQLEVGRSKSETSSITIIDRASLEERLRNLDADFHEQMEPVVALSVHGWARGHERNVVEAVKQGLRAARVAVHEIVSPADVLVMFHDMTMGMNVEHLLGRMRHAAAYSNAQDVVLVLMEAEKPRPSKNGDSYPAKLKGREKVGEWSWHMLCAAASLVVEYSYVTTDGSNQIRPHNEGALVEIVNHIRSWVSGRDSIGMSVECSQQAAVELGGVRNAPTISLGSRAVGTAPSCGGAPVHISPAALASARMQSMNSAALRGSRDSFGSLLDSCVSISESDVPVVVSASSRHRVSVDNVVGVPGGVPPIEEHVPLVGNGSSTGHTDKAASHSLTNGRGYSAGIRKQDSLPSTRSLSWSGWDLSRSDLPQGSRGINSPEKAGPPKKSVTEEGMDGGEKWGMRQETGDGGFPRKTTTTSKFLMEVGSAETKLQTAAQPNKGPPASSGKGRNELVKTQRHEKKSTLPMTDVVTEKNGRVQPALSHHPNVRDVGGAFEMDIG